MFPLSIFPPSINYCLASFNCFVEFLIVVVGCQARLRELEDDLLQRLSDSQDALLENDELLAALEASRTEAKAVQVRAGGATTRYWGKE